MYTPEHAGYHLSRLVVDPEGNCTYWDVVQPASRDGVIQDLVVKEERRAPRDPKQADQ